MIRCLFCRRCRAYKFRCELHCCSCCLVEGSCSVSQTLSEYPQFYLILPCHDSRPPSAKEKNCIFIGASTLLPENSKLWQKVVVQVLKQYYLHNHENNIMLTGLFCKRTRIDFENPKNQKYRFPKLGRTRGSESLSLGFSLTC